MCEHCSRVSVATHKWYMCLSSASSSCTVRIRWIAVQHTCRLFGQQCLWVPRHPAASLRFQLHRAQRPSWPRVQPRWQARRRGARRGARLILHLIRAAVRLTTRPSPNGSLRKTRASRKRCRHASKTTARSLTKHWQNTRSCSHRCPVLTQLGC